LYLTRRINPKRSSLLEFPRKEIFDIIFQISLFLVTLQNENKLNHKNQDLNQDFVEN